MSLKTYQGNCTAPPFEQSHMLSMVIDNAKKITRKKFMENCEVQSVHWANTSDHFTYPQDFTYWKYKNIYFYCHSCIEYFYY